MQARARRSTVGEMIVFHVALDQKECVGGLESDTELTVKYVDKETLNPNMLENQEEIFMEEALNMSVILRRKGRTNPCGNILLRSIKVKQTGFQCSPTFQ